ncbi:hypothetical protein BJF80_00255 [Serinicoccus sp. CUA-874]|nr:hypothetical protein BJF80_00255 [Serinicoccus sp. CUA-874]
MAGAASASSVWAGGLADCVVAGSSGTGAGTVSDAASVPPSGSSVVEVTASGDGAVSGSGPVSAGSVPCSGGVRSAGAGRAPTSVDGSTT